MQLVLIRVLLNACTELEFPVPCQGNTAGIKSAKFDPFRVLALIVYSAEDVPNAQLARLRILFDTPAADVRPTQLVATVDV